MKYILMLLILASCGKHSEPAAKDYRDSDGDGKPNSEEVSKLASYVSDMAPIENVKVHMSIKVGGPAITDLQVDLSNQIDLIKHSRELLVKNPKTLPVDEYFSEWSKLKIDSEKVPVLSDRPTFRVDLRFDQMNVPPDRLLLVTKEETRFLSYWSPVTSIDLTKEVLQDILSGKSFISLARKIKKHQNAEVSQDDSIKDKTYRVFMNNGVSTMIYYVSNEFSFKRFLESKGIKRSQNISDHNLLTGRHVPGPSEWWINEINGKDKVVIKDDLKSLSDFYLQGLEKQNLKIQRANGANIKSFTTTNVSGTKTLLRIRATRKLRTYKESHVNSVYGRRGGGGMNGDADPGTKCENYYYKVVAETALEVSEMELREALYITTNGLEISMSPSELEIWKGQDEKGSFYEIAFQTESNVLEIKLRNLENSTFVKEGLYNTTCQGVKLQTIASNPEANMNLSIEAYVERL